MIVITHLSDHVTHTHPGDTFNLTIKDPFGSTVLIKEEITVTKTIDFIASFRFTLEDGTCPGFHLTGIFANKHELPEEMKNAKMYEDLTEDQKRNFNNSVGTKPARRKFLQRG